MVSMSLNEAHVVVHIDCMDSFVVSMSLNETLVVVRIDCMDSFVVSCL